MPTLKVFVLGKPRKSLKLALEEISWWHNVRLYNLAAFFGIPNSKVITENDYPVLIDMLMARLLTESKYVIWFQFGYYYDPITNNNTTDLSKNIPPTSSQLLQTLQNGRNKFETLLAEIGKSRNGCIRVEDKNVKGQGDLLPPLFACSKPSLLRNTESFGDSAANLGIYKVSATTTAGCHLDLKMDAAENNLLLTECAVIGASSSQSQRRYSPVPLVKKRVAIGFPTTSRGLAPDQDPIYLYYLLPSLIRTLTEEELQATEITIYIGIDNGDPLLSKLDRRQRMIESTRSQIQGLPISVKFILLPNIRRVAQLWNIIFLRAIRDGNDYFYQVNDDLTQLSVGWLTYFVASLDQKGGFGVVGPADSHHEFNCSLLTQAMVTRVHYEIFGYLYPYEIKDWHSDTWLTSVYNPDDTHCRKDIVAKNGGVQTRYQHCLVFAYSLYLAEGKRTLEQWRLQKAP